MLTNFFLPDICFLILYLIIGVVGYFWLKKKHPTLPHHTLLLFSVSHSIFSLLYWGLSLSALTSADSTLYYQNALNFQGDWLSLLKFGTSFIQFILYPLIHYLGLSYLSCFLIFNTFGLIGISLVFVTTRSYLTSPRMKKLYAMTLFLPGLSFWTSAIGKDSLVLLGIGLTFYAVSAFKNRLPSLIFGLLITVYVRPHVFVLLLLSFVGFVIFKRNRNLTTLLVKTLLVTICISIMIASYAVILKYVGLPTDLSLNVTQKYIDTRLNYNTGNSYLELQNSGVPTKLFAYIFRPLFFDAKNMLMLIGSLENLCLLGLFGSLLWKPGRLRKIWIIKHPYYRMHLIYGIMGVFIFSMTTSNLGIAMRQKYMIIPSLLSVLFLILDSKTPVSHTKKVPIS